MQKQIQNVRLAFVIFSFSLMNNYAFSSHEGAEISYRWIDTLTYEVQYTYYRNCSGTSFTVPTNAANVVCNTTGKSERLTLTLKSVSKVKTFCDSLGQQCSGSNQSRSGDGTERLVYLDTVDFRKSPYSGLVSAGCTELRFESALCCRNSNITSGAAGKANYNFAVLSVKNQQQNSSPIFTFDPFFLLSVNQEVIKSVGAIDTIDSDSLSYSISQPYSAWQSPISSSFPPFTSYYPTGFKYPYTNPNTKPPIGFFFDEETGMLIFMPTKVDEFSVLVFEVKEWRKDSSGKYQNIGTIRRDINCRISSVNVNNTPIIYGFNETSVCEGDSFCISVATFDSSKTLPPPAVKPAPDTVSLRWNRGIPAGHFTINDPSALHQRGKFCWQTRLGDARTLPYHFTVEADDDNCPYPSKSSRVFRVTVNPMPSTEIEIDTLTCGQYVFKSKVDSVSAKLLLNYHWEVNPIGHQSNDSRTYPLFKSSGTPMSINGIDTVRFQRGGKYAIKHTIMTKSKCSVDYYDTITVPEVLEVSMATQADTFVCKGSSLQLSANVKNGSSKVTYDWSNNSNTSTSLFVLPDSVKLKNITIIVTDTNGCKAKDEIALINRPLPVLSPVKSMEVCYGDSVKVRAHGMVAMWDDPRDSDSIMFKQGSELKHVLYFGNDSIKIDSSIVLKEIQSYTMKVTDSLLCSNSVSFRLYLPPVTFDPFPDLCWNNGLTNLRSISRPYPATGRWKAIDSSGYSSASDLNKGISGDTLNTLLTSRPAEGLAFTYVLRYSQTTAGCSSFRDTFLTIRGLPEPIIDKRIFYSGNDTMQPFSICSLSPDLQLSANYAGGVWSASEPEVVKGNVFKPSNIKTTNTVVTIKYMYVDIYGCRGEDSVKLVTVDPDVMKVSPKDTSLTWYSTAMKLVIAADAGSGKGVVWKALDSGNFDDNTSLITTYNFSTNKDSVTILRVEATSVGSSKGCLPAKDTISVNVYQSPCVNFNMKLDLGTKTLTLTPLNTTMSDYTWTVADSIIKGISPKVDVSGFGDSIIWIHLETVNALGDKCKTTNRIDLKTGSLKMYNKSRLVIYPNPVKDVLIFKSDDDLTNSRVLVYSSVGQQVIGEEMKETSLNCSTLVPGVYTVVLIKENTLYHGRFLKN